MSLTANRPGKNFWPRNSLRIQLLSRSLLILAVLLAFIGLFQYLYMREVVYKNRAASLQSQILAISPAVWEQFGTGPAVGNPRPPLFLLPGVSLAFIDVDGNFTSLSNEHGGRKPPQLTTQEYLAAEKKKPRPAYKIIDEAEGPEQLLVLQPIPRAPGQLLGVVQASVATGPLKELLIRQLFTFLFLSLIALLFGLLSFFPVIKKTLGPLSNMVNAAELIDAGNLARRFPLRQGQSEIDRLAESFNGMLGRLEASFKAERETKEQMRRFVADASHELRTPLTAIHGFLEVLLRGAANQPDQLHKALKSMHSESERLNKLVDDLLLLAKLDRTPHMELTGGWLDKVIRDMEPQFRILAGPRRLDLQIEANIRGNYNPDKIKQVILNLFHNAIQHTEAEQGYIRVSLSRRNTGSQLTVQDNGPGISERHLPHVFDRFYRSDSSRTRQYGGAGLGLAISKAIVEAHGGTIRVESQAGRGCTFYVWLPAATE